MRIIVFSDSHRSFRPLHETVLKHRDEAGLFLHLGDGEREVDDLKMVFPDLPIKNVCGNCDMASMAPAADLLDVEGVRIFMTHGHMFGVKGGTGPLEEAARRRNCQIVLYGHTHVPEIRYEDGLYIMNPGSIALPRYGRPTYGVIDIVQGGIRPFIVEL